MFDVGDNKVRGHDHTTEKYWGSAHWSCNISIRLTKNIPVILDNSRGYDSHLIIREIGKFDVKESVRPNELDKCMAFTINKHLVFIDSMHFITSSPDALVKNLWKMDLKYLTQEFSGKQLK